MFCLVASGNPGSVETALALRALGIGDLVTGLPAVRGLAAAYPNRRLLLAVPAWLRPLAELAAVADGFVEIPGLDARWPAHMSPPELAVNLHGCGPQSHELLRRLRPRRLLAYRCDAAGHHEGPEWRSDEHEIDRWCRLLGHYGIDCDRADIDLRPPAAPPGLAGCTLIHPGAKDPDRRWSPQRFAQVARALRDHGHRVRVTGSADDRDLTRAVVERAGLAAADDLGGRLDLVELASVVAQARLVVSNDTGVSHLASATRTPSVTVFAAMDPALWGPPDRAYHHVVWHPDEARVSAQLALESITAGEVLSKIV